MSKIAAPIPRIPALLLFTILFAVCGGAQEIRTTIGILGDSTSATVRVKFPDDRKFKDLWFLDQYAGGTGLLSRFSSIDFRDKQGFLIARKRFTAFDGFSTSNIGSVVYLVDLKPFQVAPAAAHISWINEGRGLLMLDDFFPQGTDGRTKVKLDLPAGWKVSSSEPKDAQGSFDVGDIESAVFFIGRELREIQSTKIKISFDGKWQFSDEGAAELSQSIRNEYEKAFGQLRGSAIHVVISRFPGDLAPGSWEADTRGRTVTILSSDTPFKSQSLQRLHEQLRHEMFHLWIPEGVNLTGNYDWFYEGFALYQSLKLGVAVNRLRFEDYLDSLSQAIAIDRRLGGKMSLIDASKNRWTGDNNSVVYARGMLVAFLCDLAILDASKGKRSTDEIVREVYRRHTGEATPRDGNEAMMELMRSNKELVPIVERYVIGTEKLDLTSLLTAAGLGSADGITLKTVAKPNSRQKKLLDKLGYNNWRKLPSTRK